MKLPSRAAFLAGLVLVLALSATLRFHGQDWDQGTLLHPDERFLFMVTSKLTWPAGWAEYLDSSRSPLNPRNQGERYFAYGTLPLVLLKAALAAAGDPPLWSMAPVARAVSAAADVAATGLVVLLGLLLYGRGVGLLAGFFYAGAVLPLQQAHFFVVDPLASLFCLAALSGLALVQTGRLGRSGWLLAGVAWGLALACKQSSFLLGAAGLALVLDRAWRSWRESRSGAEVRRTLWSGVGDLALLGGTALVVLRLAAPDIFRPLGWGLLFPEARWLKDLRITYLTIVLGTPGFPPSIQWYGLAPVLHPWWQMVRWGLGPALGFTAWLAWAAAAWRWLARGRARHLLPVVWSGLVLGWLGASHTMYMRYFLPAYPTLCLLAAWGLLALGRAVGERPVARWAARALTAGVALASLGWALAFSAIYDRPEPRLAATAWIYRHIPPGATLAHEIWDDALPLSLPEQQASRQYHIVGLPWAEPDDPGKLARVLDILDRADYLVLASDRLRGSLPRLPGRYPFTLNYYRALEAGRLGFRLAAEFASFPHLGSWVFPDLGAEESFTVYEHPRVQIFEKTPAYSRQKARQEMLRGVGGGLGGRDP
ncbi:MAG: glycosyltransferase family 39 protein [Deltaproteobacteria bacterium]|nr:glycosyltransferase family 39 protein [Deltaproteobacteria bacterium]